MTPRLAARIPQRFSNFRLHKHAGVCASDGEPSGKRRNHICVMNWLKVTSSIRKRNVRWTILPLLLLGPFCVTGAELITYDYDSAGRLTGTSHGFGKTTSYTYDATGNLLRSANTVIADSDNDGMADSWELTFFTNLTRVGSGDFDLDGFTDLSEFLAGTLPNNPDSLLRLTRNVTNTIASTTVEWQSVSGKKYRVQYKNALTDPGWNDLPGDVTASGATTTKTDTTTPGEPMRFYRVQVIP